MKFSGENRHLRQARNRYGQVYRMTSYILNNNYYIYKKVEISNHSKKRGEIRKAILVGSNKFIHYEKINCSYYLNKHYASCWM